MAQQWAIKISDDRKNYPFETNVEKYFLFALNWNPWFRSVVFLNKIG